MTLEFNPDTPFEELGDKELRYLAYKLVNRYKALRMDIEEELDFHNSLVRVATKYREIISRDAELKRLYASSTADATKGIPELEAMLGQMQTIQADILQTAHAARSILRERRKR